MEMKNRRIVGYFSRDERNQITGMDLTALRYIDMGWERDGKQVHYDLSKTEVVYGDPNRTKGKGEPEFEYLLQELLLAKTSILTPGSDAISADLVFPNGVMKYLLVSPVDDRDLVLRAAKYRGTVYLARIDQDFAYTPDHQKYCTWGDEFENIFARGPKNMAFRVMMKSEIGDKKLLGMGSVDAVDSAKFEEGFKDLHNFVDLTTAKDKFMGTQIMSPYKARDLWSQNYLIGVPKVVCGYRNDDGVVHTLKCLRVDVLPRVAKMSKRPRELVKALSQTLTEITEHVAADDCAASYELRVRRGAVLSCAQSAAPLLTRQYLDGMFGPGLENAEATVPE